MGNENSQEKAEVDAAVEQKGEQQTKQTTKPTTTPSKTPVASSTKLPSYATARATADQLHDATPPVTGPTLVRQVSFADDDIHYACRMGNITKIAHYLEQKPQVLHMRDEYGNIPLYYACLCGQQRAVEFLLANGAYDIEGFDRCWRNALNIEIRHVLRAHQKQYPDLYANLTNRVALGLAPKLPTVGQPTTATAASSSSISSTDANAKEPIAAAVSNANEYQTYVKNMHVLLGLNDPSEFLVNLQQFINELTPLLIAAPKGGKQKPPGLQFKDQANVKNLLPESSEVSLVPSPQATHFLAFLVTRLQDFGAYPHILNAGFRLLSLLCLNHSRNLEIVMVELQGIQLLEQFVNNYLIPGEGKYNSVTAPLASLSISSTSSSSSAATTRTLFSNEPDFVYTFITSLEYLLRTTPKSGGKSHNFSTASINLEAETHKFLHLLPFLLTVMKNFLDFPPMIVTVLLILKKLLGVADERMLYQFLMFQGIQMCVAAYLAYAKVPANSLDPDEDGDGSMMSATALAEAAAEAAAEKGLDEESAIPSSTSTTTAPPPAILKDAPNDRASRTQLCRLAMQLLHIWIELPRAEESGELFHVLAPSHGYGIQESPTTKSTTGVDDVTTIPPPSAAKLLQEAYSFLRLDSFSPNPLIDLGASYGPMLGDRLLADVAFEFVDDAAVDDGALDSSLQEPIFAHKIILAARCEYWRSYFMGRFGDSGLKRMPLSRQVSASSIDRNSSNPDSFIQLIRIRDYSRETFLRFLEYVYVGLGSKRLHALSDASLTYGQLIERQVPIWQKVGELTGSSVGFHGTNIAINGPQPGATGAAAAVSVVAAPPSHEFSSLTESPLVGAPPVLLDYQSNLVDYLSLLRLSDEYQLTQLRIFLEYLIYHTNDKTHLINPETVWTILTSALNYHSPLLEYRCLKYIVSWYSKDEERVLLQAKNFRRSRQQVLRSYGFL